MKSKIYNPLLSISLLPIISIIISSCAPIPREEDNDKKYFNGRHSLEGVLRLAEISCNDPQVCPENVGLVINFSQKTLGYEVGSCTGFLVAPDIVATNSHCVENSSISSNYPFLESKIKLENNCPKHLGIKFANRIAGEHRREYICKEMIFKSDYSDNKITENADYAYFRIETTPRKPLVISREGVDNHETLHMIRVTSNTKLTNFFDVGHYLRKKFESSTCQNRYGININLNGVNRWSPTSTLLNCSIYQGNSGSPVFNQNNQVVGILHAGVWPRSPESQDGRRQDKVDLSYTKSKHAIYTNAICIKDPTRSVTLAAQCNESRRLTLLDCLTKEEQQELLKPIENDINSTKQNSQLGHKLPNPDNFAETFNLKLPEEDRTNRIGELKQKGLCQFLEK